MKIIKVKLKKDSYNIIIGNNIVKQIPLQAMRLGIGNFAVIVTCRKVYALYGRLIKTIFSKSCKVIIVPDGEKAKTKDNLFKVIDGLLEATTLNRKIYLVCLGGGTVGDLGGFAAAVYKRGIPYIQVPTTLLSQIDASIGGKTAIDLTAAKNILGSFYQPKAVFIDPIFLKTLGRQEINEGLAEAIKYGAIASLPLFNFLKNNIDNILNLDNKSLLKIISECVRIKARIVSVDEKEDKGIRTILNFGHTVAHALEASTRYGKLTHGQAVSLGMLVAVRLSYLLGYCKIDGVNSIREILKLFSLPTELKFDYESFIKAVKYDKKFITGNIRMVILEKIGKVKVVSGISLEKLMKSMEIIRPC